MECSEAVLADQAVDISKNMPRQNMREVVDKNRFFFTKKKFRHLKACKSESVSLCFQMFCQAVPLRSARTAASVAGSEGSPAHGRVRQKSLQGTMGFHQN